MFSGEADHNDFSSVEIDTYNVSRSGKGVGSCSYLLTLTVFFNLIGDILISNQHDNVHRCTGENILSDADGCRSYQEHSECLSALNWLRSLLNVAVVAVVRFVAPLGTVVPELVEGVVEPD